MWHFTVYFSVYDGAITPTVEATAVTLASGRVPGCQAAEANPGQFKQKKKKSERRVMEGEVDQLGLGRDSHRSGPGTQEAGARVVGSRNQRARSWEHQVFPLLA